MLNNIKTAIRGFVTSTLGQVILIGAGVVVLFVYGVMSLIANIVGLPMGLSMLIATVTIVVVAFGAICVVAKRRNWWSSGGTVGAVIFVLVLLGFLMWEGTRIYLYASDLWQWSFNMRWGWFAVSWISVAAAGGIFVSLVYKGPKVVIWAFALLSVWITGTAIIDASQFGPVYRSPFSGEVMVKKSIDDNGDVYPLYKGAASDRQRPWITKFEDLDLSKEGDRQILKDWYQYRVSTGDSDVTVAARKDCDARKAAARTAHRPEPECTVNGSPQDMATSALKSIASATGMAVDYAGLSPAEFPISVSLDQEGAMKFRADPVGDEAAGLGKLQLVVCQATQGFSLRVEASGRGVTQTQASVGRPISIVFDPGVKSGEQVIEVRQTGIGHIEAVIGRGGLELNRACPPHTTGALIGVGMDVRDQNPAAQ